MHKWASNKRLLVIIDSVEKQKQVDICGDCVLQSFMVFKK